MANTKSAAKHARQTVQRTARNQSIRSAVKTRQRKLRAAIDAGDRKAAQEAYTSFSSTVDKAAKRGVIHQNSADRRKSLFSKSLAGLK